MTKVFFLKIITIEKIMKKLNLVFGSLPADLFFISGCTGFVPCSQVTPSSPGKPVTLMDLAVQSGEYKILYSGSRVDPAAVLFVLKLKRDDLE